MKIHAGHSVKKTDAKKHGQFFQHSPKVNYKAWIYDDWKYVSIPWQTIRAPQLKKSIHALLELDNGLIVTGSAEVIQTLDERSEYGVKTEHTHEADICIWDIDNKQLVSHYRSPRGGVEFLIELKKDLILIAANGQHIDCYANIEILDLTNPKQPKQIGKVSLPKNCWISDVKPFADDKIALLIYSNKCAADDQNEYLCYFNWQQALEAFPEEYQMVKEQLIHVGRATGVFVLNDQKLVVRKSCSFSLFELTQSILQETKIISFPNKRHRYSEATQLQNGNIIHLDETGGDGMTLICWSFVNEELKSETIPLSIDYHTKSYGVELFYAMYESSNGEIFLQHGDRRTIQVNPTTKKVKEFSVYCENRDFVFINNAQQIARIGGYSYGGLTVATFPMKKEETCSPSTYSSNACRIGL